MIRIPEEIHYQILELMSNLDNSWVDMLSSAENYNILAGTLYTIANAVHTPPRHEIFTALGWCPVQSIKVVIIGQDPYPQLLPDGRTRAMGAAFSFRMNDPINPRDRSGQSLINIYKELADTVPGFKPPAHGYLESWGRQGVLLLNTALTTLINQPAAHKTQWKEFIKKVINHIERENKHFCYLLWGSHAINLGVGKSRKQFTSPHPVARDNSYFGCNHFNKANEYLMSIGLEPIDWTSICR